MAQTLAQVAGSDLSAANRAEANQIHIYLRSARANPLPQAPTTVTPAFGILNFPKVVRLLGDDNLVIRQKAVTAAVEMLSTAESRVQCVAAGIIPALAELIKDEDVYIRQQTAQALRNAAVIKRACVEMKDTKAIRGLIFMLLDDADEYVRAHSFEAMYEAIDSLQVRYEVVGTVRVLERLVEKAEVEGFPSCQLALEIACRCLAGPTESLALQQLLGGRSMPRTLRLLSHANPSMREHVSRLICRLCVPSDGKTEAVETGLVPLLVGLLEDNDMRVQAAAAAALMSITVHNAGKEAFIAAQGVPVLVHLLDPQDEILCFHILQVMVNVAEDPSSKDGLQCVLPLLTHISTSCPSALLQRYALQATQQIKFKHLPFMPLNGQPPPPPPPENVGNDMWKSFEERDRSFIGARPEDEAEDLGGGDIERVGGHFEHT